MLKEIDANTSIKLDEGALQTFQTALRGDLIGPADPHYDEARTDDYVNFMMEEGQQRIQATYRDNYQRLVAIKKKYDPHNLFHVNQNIQPDGL